MGCKPSITSGSGQHEHPLEQVDRPGRWYCNKCANVRDPKKGDIRWRCLQGCDFDICNRCKLEMLALQKRQEAMLAHQRGHEAPPSSPPPAATESKGDVALEDNVALEGNAAVPDFLAVGSYVEIQGLTSATEWNGRRAHVLSVQPGHLRYLLDFGDGGVRAIAVSNVCLSAEPPPPAAKATNPLPQVAPVPGDVSGDLSGAPRRPSLVTEPCEAGCGRARFGTFPTCCTRCTGPSGPHTHDCLGKSQETKAAGRDAAEWIGDGDPAVVCQRAALEEQTRAAPGAFFCCCAPEPEAPPEVVA